MSEDIHSLVERNGTAALSVVSAISRKAVDANCQLRACIIHIRKNAIL